MRCEKGEFTQKWKLPHDLLTLKPYRCIYTFFIKMNAIGSFKFQVKTVLNFPSLIMAVNGGRNFEA